MGESSKIRKKRDERIRYDSIETGSEKVSGCAAARRSGARHPQFRAQVAVVEEYQAWRFIAVRDRKVLKELSQCGEWAGHIANAALCVAILTPEPTEKFQTMFDAGQAASCKDKVRHNAHTPHGGQIPVERFECSPY